MGKIFNNLALWTMLGLASLLPTKANAQTYFPPLDSKVQVYRQPDNTRPMVWDTLMTWDKTQAHFKPFIEEDKTDTIKPRLDFVSGNFAMQAHLNFYGTSGYQIIPNLNFKYDTTNISKFNVPLYIVHRINNDNGKGHGMNAFFAGDNPSKGNIGTESITDFYDWCFVEPQTDSINVQPGEVVDGGLVPIPINSTLEIQRVYWSDENTYSTEPFLTFNIVNGVPTLASYDTARLVLERNFAPEGFELVNPADGAQFASCNDSINFSWRKSKDRDAADTVKYKLRVKNKNTGLETIFSDITDTTSTAHSRILSKGNFEWYVEATDGKEYAYSDTSEFSIRNTPPTQPSFTNVADNDTLRYNNGKFVVKYSQADDADGDNKRYLFRISNGTDVDTIFSTTADSVEVDGGIFQPASKYTLEGKVTDGTDTTSFSNSGLEFFTPSVTGVERINDEITPDKYSLSQNYPNPFNPQTKIRYSLPQTSDVSLKVYDVLGREVKTLVEGKMNSGEYEVDFDASMLPSGVYFYRLQTGEVVQTKKMVVNK